MTETLAPSPCIVPRRFGQTGPSRTRRALIAALAVLGSGPGWSHAATLPAGFVES
jgi:hypothetical protein